MISYINGAVSRKRKMKKKYIYVLIFFNKNEMITIFCEDDIKTFFNVNNIESVRSSELVYIWEHLICFLIMTWLMSLVN